jgi:hypothetical protein
LNWCSTGYSANGGNPIALGYAKGQPGIYEMDVFWQKAHKSKLESNANSATIDTILKVFKALKEEINFNEKLEAHFVKLT